MMHRPLLLRWNQIEAMGNTLEIASDRCLRAKEAESYGFGSGK
jgi:hypothetical protein